jgi:hypothetical protein
MPRESILILLGVFIALSPFVGLPYSWLMWFVLVLGLLVIAQGISLRAKKQKAPPREVTVAPVRDLHDETPQN